MTDQKLKANVVLGDWDKETIRLDFDNTPLGEVKLWSFRALIWFKLSGFIILESSARTYQATDKDKVIFKYTKKSYSVVFDRKVTWSFNVKVMNWVALQTHNEGLENYVRMQCIKQTSTLRLSNKGKKPIPKVVFGYGNRDNQVLKFLETRIFVLKSLERLNYEKTKL